jgi:site-specific recombinase XerD
MRSGVRVPPHVDVTVDWKRVVALWRASGRTSGTIQVYAYWAGRYATYCDARGKPLLAELTRARVEKFVAEQVRGRRQRGRSLRIGSAPCNAVRALSCALGAMGEQVPTWRAPSPPSPPSRSIIVRGFVEYRLRHRGVAKLTTLADARVASAFLGLLRSRGRRLADTRVVDLDDFVLKLASKWAPKTVAGDCSTLRAFLRYLHATGRLPADLAACVAAPRIRRIDRPPRALPWRDVLRILRAIDVRRPLGCRDFALFLMMATYGMGAGEVCGLRLDDVDWTARTVRVRRPKTGVVTLLPLLDPVARALARYLRDERPAHAQDRAVFVTSYLPHRRLACSTTIRHRLHRYAHAAGVHADFLGTHVFRHAHATRQIEGGASVKVVGDVLGHRRPSSTSVYTRSAILRLRAIALPVPR